MDLSIAISAGALLTAAFSADVGPGVWVGAGLRGGPFAVDLELRGILPAKAFAREPYDPKNPRTTVQQLDVSSFTVNLVPCARFKYLLGCGVLQAGALFESGSVHSFSVDRQLAVGPRVGVELPFADRFAVFGFAEVLITLDQRAFSFTYANVKWAESTGTVFFGAGASINL